MKVKTNSLIFDSSLRFSYWPEIKSFTNVVNYRLRNWLGNNRLVYR